MENKIKAFFESIADNWNNSKDDVEKIDELLFKEININKGEDILDLGCGKGIVTPLIYKYTNKKVIGIDLSEKMIEGAIKKNNDDSKYEYICGDYLDYSFNHKFDKIIIFNAFPHFLDKFALAKKAYNDLKEDGFLIVMHNLGKDELNGYHHDHADKISNGLKSPLDEEKELENFFKLVKFIDEKNRYLMVLKRR